MVETALWIVRVAISDMIYILFIPKPRKVSRA